MEELKIERKTEDPQVMKTVKQQIGQRLASQFSSGRWLLTVTAGLAFLSFSLATAYVILKQRAEYKPETIVAMFSGLLLLIQGVYKDYFYKNGDDKKGQGS